LNRLALSIVPAEAASMTASSKQLMLQIHQHINDLSLRNVQFVDQHAVRVACLAGRIAVHLEFPEDECYKTSEAGLVHDVGKNDDEAQNWYALWKGRRAPRKQKRHYRVLHTLAGKKFLQKMDLLGFYSSMEELYLSCLFHHEAYSRLPEIQLVRERIIVVQVSDIYDACTAVDDCREYRKRHLPPSKVIRMLRENAAQDDFCSACVEALVQCKDLTLN
jgi:HD-GYP domain-containing protein (c-di-GMP phosphodiesterase class II)